MKTYLILILGFALAGCSTGDRVFRQGSELVGKETPLGSFSLVDGSAEKHYGSFRMVPSDHPPFDSAFEVTVDRLTIFSWDLMLVKTIEDSVRTGDVLYVEFYAKSVQPKPKTRVGQISLKFNSFLIFPVEIDSVWRKYASYAVAEKDVAPSESQIRFECAFEPQVVAIGGIRFHRFDPGFDVEGLEGITPLYSVDPAWEKEADARIDSLRKGTGVLTLTDQEGNPLPFCDYRLEMVNHAFSWGTAIGPSYLIDTSQTGQVFRQVLKHNFNQIVFEDHLKWRAWEDPVRRADVFRAVEWLEENGFGMRGHCLVWPWFDFPLQLKKAGNDTTALISAIRAHIVEEASAMKGHLVDWDVLNEPFVAKDTHNIFIYRDIRELNGIEEVVNWYRRVHGVDPEPRLFINDFDILSDGALFETHKDHYEEIISQLLENGAPLHGIGFQGHFEGSLTPPQKVLEVLDRYGRFGLPMLVTEFDVDMSAGHEEEMYRFTHDFLKACFSHPGFDGFLNWGFWARRHWKPRTAFFDAEWNLSPGGSAWRDLIYGQWWSTGEGKTDAYGQLTFRGFYGDYRITYQDEGQTVERTFSLQQAGK
jgi:GH35 family endo-1,4-beta-xylanase